MKKKFSSGTQGRIKAWADECRTVILSASPTVLGKEFIDEVQGTGKNFDPLAWQQFENIEQVKEKLADWLKPQ